jgi:hypothetical protein
MYNPEENAYEFSEVERRGNNYMDDSFYDGATGLAAGVEDEPSHKGFLSRFKKTKSQVKEKSKKEKKEKVNSKSTKNLIFLHGQDKQTAKARFKLDINGREIQQNVGDTQDLESIKVEQVINSEFGNLPPLDEIRVPDLTRGGYSIHSENMY